MAFKLHLHMVHLFKPVFFSHQFAEVLLLPIVEFFTPNALTLSLLILMLLFDFVSKNLVSPDIFKVHLIFDLRTEHRYFFEGFEFFLLKHQHLAPVDVFSKVLGFSVLTVEISHILQIFFSLGLVTHFV